MPASSNSPEDRLRRRIFWAMPSGLYVIGSRSGPERNGMTLSWATQVSSAPIRVGIAVQKSAVTHRLIASGGVFSLNLLHRADRALVRKFVKPAAFDPDAQTLNGVPIRDGVTGAPILIQAAAYLDCDVVQAVDTGDHTFFVGSVLDANFGSIEGEIAESAAPEVLRMEDTRMNYGG